MLLVTHVIISLLSISVMPLSASERNEDHVLQLDHLSVSLIYVVLMQCSQPGEREKPGQVTRNHFSLIGKNRLFI